MVKYFFALTLTCSVAFASGTSVGNGGGAFICHDDNESETLDLFEARLDGLTVQLSPDLAESQVLRALEKTGRETVVYSDLINIFKTIKSATKKEVPSNSIKWPSDALSVFTKPGCREVGIIIYNDSTETMWIDQENFEQLSSTNQAALWVHETVYKYLRRNISAKDSVLARKITGMLFSSEHEKISIDEWARLTNITWKSPAFSTLTWIAPIHGVSTPPTRACNGKIFDLSFNSRALVEKVEGDLIKYECDNLNTDMDNECSDKPARYQSVSKFILSARIRQQICLAPGAYAFVINGMHYGSYDEFLLYLRDPADNGLVGITNCSLNHRGYSSTNTCEYLSRIEHDNYVGMRRGLFFKVPSSTRVHHW